MNKSMAKGTKEIAQEDLFGALAPATAAASSKTTEPRIYSVTELSEEIRESLRKGFGNVRVQGEIADFKGVHRNGHLYCSLKDETSNIRMVRWRGALQKVPFEIKGGLEVIVSGKLDFYGGSGSLQISAEHIEPKGMGSLQLKFEQLKEKLQKEGLFDDKVKRRVSPVNWRIGIITGKSTAALQDMLKVYRQRFPLAEICIFQASVQGERAAPEMVEQLERANRYSRTREKPLDVLVIGRGGGSYEDLFCFNDERLARAIRASQIPVVSAVGHEIDFTIADFVSDKRAATPSNAAELTVPEKSNWLERLAQIGQNFHTSVLDQIHDMQLRVDHLSSRLINISPLRRLKNEREQLYHRSRQMRLLAERRLQFWRSEIMRRASVLDALSPLKVLERGYALARDAKGKALKSVAQVQIGESVELSLKDGILDATIVKKGPSR